MMAFQNKCTQIRASFTYCMIKIVSLKYSKISPCNHCDFYVFTNPFITIIFYCRGKCESQRHRGGKVWGLRIWVTKRKLWSRGGFGGYPPRRGYCRHGCCRTYRYSNDCYSCCSHAADKPDAEFEDDEN